MKEINSIENEIIFIERSINNLNLFDRFIFLVSRLYKNFYLDLDIKSTRLLGTIVSKNISLTKKAEDNFLEEYGNAIIKNHILKIIFNSENGIINVLCSHLPTFLLTNLNHSKSKLINNRNLLQFSLFMLGEKEIKKIISYELTLESENELQYSIQLIKGYISELNFRIGYSHSWDLFNEFYRYEQRQYPKEIISSDPFTCEEELLFDNGSYINEMITFLEIPEKRKLLHFQNIEIWLDELNLDKIKSEVEKNKKLIKKDKFVITFNPKKLSDLIIEVFEKHNIIIDKTIIRKINRFIINTCSWQSKFPSVVNASDNSSMDFLTKKSLILLVKLIITLMKLDYIKMESALRTKDILKNELQTINKNHIGLSDNLRNIISNEIITTSENNLIKDLGFTSKQKINEIIKY